MLGWFPGSVLRISGDVGPFWEERIDSCLSYIFLPPSLEFLKLSLRRTPKWHFKYFWWMVNIYFHFRYTLIFLELSAQKCWKFGDYKYLWKSQKRCLFNQNLNKMYSYLLKNAENLEVNRVKIHWLKFWGLKLFDKK